MKGCRGRECLEKEVIDPYLLYHELEPSLLVCVCVRVQVLTSAVSDALMMMLAWESPETLKPLLQLRRLTGESWDSQANFNTLLLSAYRWMTTHWGGRDWVEAWKNTVKLFFFLLMCELSYDSLLWLPAPRSQLPAWGCKNEQKWLGSKWVGYFLVKGDWKLANLLSPVIQAAQVPVGSSFCS